MRRRSWLPVLWLWIASGASATSISYQAALSGASESPPIASAGTGTATLTYDDVGRTLRVQTTFSGLTGTTTVAHIHCCVSPSAPNPVAGVATALPSFPGFPAGVTSGSYDQTFDLTQAASWNPSFISANGGTTASAEAALTAGLVAGMAYLNIHTSFAPGGEIRGFVVPEPGTAGLLLLGGLLLARRRARARAA